MGYDSKSHDLAAHFIQDRPTGISDKEVRKFTHDLAKHIQQAAEDWFEARGRSGWASLEDETRAEPPQMEPEENWAGVKRGTAANY